MKSLSSCKADMALALVAGRVTKHMGDSLEFILFADLPIDDCDRRCLFTAAGTLASPDISVDRCKLGGVLIRLSEGRGGADVMREEEGVEE